MGGLLGFAAAAFPIDSMLPPGVRTGRRAHPRPTCARWPRSAAWRMLLDHVRSLVVPTEEDRLLVHLEAGPSHGHEKKTESAQVETRRRSLHRRKLAETQLNHRRTRGARLRHCAPCFLAGCSRVACARACAIAISPSEVPQRRRCRPARFHVLDRDRQPCETDLADFTVLEDGNPQPIVSFEELDSPSRTVRWCRGFARSRPTSH